MAAAARERAIGNNSGGRECRPRAGCLPAAISSGGSGTLAIAGQRPCACGQERPVEAGLEAYLRRSSYAAPVGRDASKGRASRG